MLACGCVVDKNRLYCASQSQARHELLQHGQIPFVVIKTSVVEEEAEVSGTVQEQVTALAEYKHSGIEVADIVLKQTKSKGRLYFVTADTLIAGTHDGIVYGKTANRQHALAMIYQISRQEIIIATGMCLSVWDYDTETGLCERVAYETWVAQARAEYIVPDDEREYYLDACPIAMKGCGAAVIDGIGITYFKSIYGSYTGALGLDMYELSRRLTNYGFFRRS